MPPSERAEFLSFRSGLKKLDGIESKQQTKRGLENPEGHRRENEEKKKWQVDLITAGGGEEAGPRLNL